MTTEFLFGMVKKLWKWILVEVVQHCNATESHLKMVKMVKFYIMYILPQFLKI